MATTTTLEKKGTTAETPNEVPSKVIIKQFRRNGWLDPGHDGEFQFTNTATILCAQPDKTSGLPKTGLTQEDETRLEKAIGVPAGTLARSSSYWDQDKFKIELPKGGKTIFPRTKTSDEIIWRVGLAHQEIANSEAEKVEWPFAKYVMTSEEEETRETNKVINVKADAFGAFLSMTEESLKDFLIAYGKNPGKNARLDFLKAQVGKIVDSEPETFLDLIKSHDYKEKIFLRNLVDKGIVRENGGKYTMVGGEVLGYSFAQAVDFLMKPENQETKVSLKGQLSASK